MFIGVELSESKNNYLREVCIYMSMRNRVVHFLIANHPQVITHAFPNFEKIR